MHTCHLENEKTEEIIIKYMYMWRHEEPLRKGYAVTHGNTSITCEWFVDYYRRRARESAYGRTRKIIIIVVATDTNIAINTATISLSFNGTPNCIGTDSILKREHLCRSLAKQTKYPIFLQVQNLCFLWHVLYC